jgi:hypothetical protein
MSRIIEKILYLLSSLLVKFGVWLDEVAYDITVDGIQLMHNLYHGVYKWQKRQ